MSENIMTKLVFSLFCPKNDQHQFLMTISIQIKGKDYENQWSDHQRGNYLVISTNSVGKNMEIRLENLYVSYVDIVA